MHHASDTAGLTLDRRAFLVAGGSGFCSLALPGLAATAPSEPIRIGPYRQLFIDNRFIASSRGLMRTWHRPEKFAGNPVLRRDQFWEGRGPYVYGTVIRQGKLFKLWYNCYVGGRPDYWVCYATSADGIHWDRPALNVVADPRLRPGNNVVMVGSGLPNYRQCLSPTVLYRPQERDVGNALRGDPQRRYAMLYWDINAGRSVQFAGVCLAFSPDGIRWTNVKNNPVFDGASDVTDGCYDPQLKRYLLHYKMWRVEGKVVASKGAGFAVGNVSHWTTWDAIPLAGGRVRFQGRLVNYSARDPQPVRASVDFAREPTYRRVVARAESPDLVHWSRARLIFELPQKGDPAGTSTYGMSVFPYEGMYLGILRVFHNEREIDLELASSHDDLTWKRASPGTAFIGRGPAKSHDAGMVFSANAPVAVADELWFYYGAFTGHHGVADKQQDVSIGLAKLRRDGFVSLDAGKEMGELATVPFRLEGQTLTVNAAARKGELTVEVRDSQGRARPGFAFADCNAFHADAVTHPVTWRRGARIESLKGQAVQLVFRLRQARLYAFQADIKRD